ncbi:hypothetical protein CKM354_000464500 [Cercospora kikuchii]|uniref:Uncharacterized protein n=1 Tax=Cercospora kikuchii TaxID=84275 RepID=A0A9P3FFZ4_9PEZI|nr:uncharacterized protein CKM354_000464500 [Cercospora kikuchii]GIZ41339.1 hypothetical protein CKM354_000464500 [Cercospora kikuchii]
MVGIKAAALALLTLLGLAEKNSDDKSGDKFGSECVKYDDKDQTKCRTWRLFDIKYAKAKDFVRVIRECERGCYSLGEGCVLDRPDDSVKGDRTPLFACTPDKAPELPLEEGKVPLMSGPDFGRVEL